MSRPPTERCSLHTRRPRAAIRNSAWTQPLKWSFLGLQVAGIYLAGTILVVLFIAAWILLSLLLNLFGKTDTSYLDVVQVLFLYASQQPLLVAIPVIVVVASILTTRGAFRQKAWAHWAAMALVAASMTPFIAVAVAFRDWVWWMLALPYSAACIGFLVAMTYAVARYGPWGATRSPADALITPPTL